MFTKVGELFYRNHATDGTKDVGKKYVYADDLSPTDIVRLVERSDYGIKCVDVHIDDDYSYGAGRYWISDFYKYCSDTLLMIGSLGFDVPQINARIVFFPEKRAAFLHFHHVKEMPTIELDDILGSACRFIGEDRKETNT